ncbi:MAG: HAD family hydrolase [Candidatus Caldarchaeales archaeon]
MPPERTAAERGRGLLGRDSRPDRKVRAVLFDLFGTLVPRYPVEGHRESLRRMGEVLGVDWTRFAEAWVSRLEERIRGSCREVGECIRRVLEEIGAEAEDRRLSEAARIRLEFVRSCVVPFGDVEPSIRELRSMGLRIGILSNSSPEVPGIWRSLEVSRLVDVHVFSCEVGIAKPDPRAFRIASSMLGVNPEEVVFVSDGPLAELEEARRVGMRSVMIDRYGTPVGWDGEVVRDLRELVEKMRGKPGVSPRGSS